MPAVRALQPQKLDPAHVPRELAWRNLGGERGRLTLANGRRGGAWRNLGAEFLRQTLQRPVRAPEIPRLEGTRERLEPANGRRAGAFPPLRLPRHVQPRGAGRS